MTPNVRSAAAIAALLAPGSDPGLLGLVPGAARRAFNEVKYGQQFHSTVAMPKGCNKGVVERGLDRLLIQRLPEKEALEGFGMLASEKKYVLDVAAEFRAWQVEHEKAVDAVGAAVTKPIEAPVKEPDTCPTCDTLGACPECREKPADAPAVE